MFAELLGIFKLHVAAPLLTGEKIGRFVFVEFMLRQEICIFKFSKTDVTLVTPVATVGTPLARTKFTTETHTFNLNIFA